MQLSPKEVDDRLAEYEDAIQRKSQELQKMNPNLRAAERYAEVDAKAAQAEKEHKESQERVIEAEGSFRRVRDTRMGLFVAAFNHVAKRIDGVYRELTRSSVHATGGKASLHLDGADDPFEGDRGAIRFTAIPPAKRFKEMDQLSGGERTMAALALLFALHSYKPAPFFVMDEVSHFALTAKPQN